MGKEQIYSIAKTVAALPDRRCVICGEWYRPTMINQKYCSDPCRRVRYEQQRKTYHPKPCSLCGEKFTPKTHNQKYCSDECAKSARIERTKTTPKKKRRETKGVESREKFGNLRFWSEHQFEEWFKENYALFGISKIHKIDAFFPDVIAETMRGDVIRIELELCSPNFKAHGHDPSDCDLVISFVRPKSSDEVCGVPVVAVFTAGGLQAGLADYDPDSMVLTPYFQRIADAARDNLYSYMESHPYYNPHKRPKFLDLYKTVGRP